MTSADTVEDTAFGRYQLLERLGTGGMAEVFKAKSFGVEGFEKTLVIKRLLPDLAQDASFVDMFIHEAKLAVRLSHANVVQVFDLGKVQQPGAPPAYFMAMEYVAGVDFATLLERCRQGGVSVPIGLCVFVGSEVAKGLDHAHRRRDDELRALGIVHRDVSPQNILLSWDGEVKITDFGIAKARHSLEDFVAGGDRVLRGKYAYMSPEQARGEPVDAASDLFSLGTVLYEAISGGNPFVGATGTETLSRVRIGECPPLHRVRPDVGQDLADIIGRAMAVHAADRHTSVGRLYEELLAYVYSSGTRFGAGDLAEFMERVGEPGSESQPDLAFLDAPTSAADSVTSPGDVITEVTSAPEVEAAPVDSAAVAAQAFQGRREASVLVLLFHGEGAVPAAVADARELMVRYGARVGSAERGELVGAFGLEQADARDTENAVRCALALTRALRSDRFRIGAGVVAGPLQLDASGLPVDDERSGRLNAAARELARLAPGRVAVSRRAAPNLRGMFELHELPGDRDGMLVGAMKPLHDVYQRFVGRRAELRELGKRLAESSQRRLQVVGLVGEHGIGKTRLLHEMQRRIARGSFNVGTYVATCPPRGHDMPLSGVAAMLRKLCGVREGDTAERIASVAPGLRALGLVADEVQGILTELGLSRPEAPPGTSGQLRSAVTRMFGSLAEDRLQVFAWDNAQEIDPESVELLGGAVERLAAARVMLLFAARPCEEAPFAKIPGYGEIAVSNLGPDDTLRLVADRIGAREVPDELRDFVADRAGGHPMFIEELLREAIGAGAIGVESKRVAVLRLERVVAVPRSLRAMLGDRVARLPDGQRDLVIAAAVLGAPVDTSVLASMLGVSIGTVNANAESVEAARLMVRLGPVALGFLSPLLAEVVTSGLDGAALADLHRRAADAYLAVLGPNADRQAAPIARHLAEAGERDRAAGLYATSGLRFLDARRLDRAAFDLARALDLADIDGRGSEEIGEWVSGLRRAVQLVRGGPALPSLIPRLAGRIGKAAAMGSKLATRTLIDLGLVLGYINRPREAEDLLREAASRAERWPEVLRAALIAEADVLLRRGEFKRALEVLQQAGHVGAQDPSEEHRALMITCQAMGGAGHASDALDAIESAAALPGADDVTFRYERAKARALIHAFQRDWASCATASEQAAEQARAARLQYEVALNLHNAGESLMRLGQFPQAYATLQKSVSVARQCAAERLVNHNRMMLDYLDALNGSQPAKTDLVGRLEYAEQHRWTWDVISGRYLFGKLLRLQGEDSEARKELELARERAAAAGNQLTVDDCSEELDLLATT